MLVFCLFCVTLVLLSVFIQKRRPTRRMRRYAEDIARRRGESLDPSILRSFGDTRRFLNANANYKIRKRWRLKR